MKFVPASIKFFIDYLTKTQLVIFCLFFYLHIYSHFKHLDAEKILTNRIISVLENKDDNIFSKELSELIFTNAYHLIIYSITMFVIEAIGKYSIKNAVNYTANKMIHTDLSTIKQQKYEHNITSIVHHSENINLAIRNLFIEFPRKILASYHFMVALKELSWKIMLYCVISNIIFIAITFAISFIRKNLVSKVLDNNIKFSLVCSDLANSIQTYQVDDRLKEYQSKINKITDSTYCYSSIDSLMVASTNAISGFSSQFMVGIISYMCRPLVLNKSITIENLSYGIRASSKFIEKMIDVVEYFGDVIRQYKSFNFFSKKKVNMIDVRGPHKNVSKIDHIEMNKIIEPNNAIIIRPHNSTPKPGKIVRITGPNGVGKTTILLKFLGVNYLGSKTNGIITAFDGANNFLFPLMYRKYVAFVQQAVPITYDTVAEYFAAVSCTKFIDTIEVFDYYGIDSFTKNSIFNFIEQIKNTRIRELSGGQAKLVQLIAAISKLYYNNGFILVLDEPSNNLDTDKIEFLKQIMNKCIEKGINIFLVTHDDRIICNKYLVFSLE